MSSSGRELTCVFFPDLHPWEREGVKPIIAALKGGGTVHEIESSERIPSSTDAVWVIARNWKKAVRATYRKSKLVPIFASVFGLSPDTRNLFTLLWRRIRPAEFTKVKIFAHSPINHRFFSEIEGLRGEQIVYLPLCTENREPPISRKSESSTVIGAFGRFEEETNLNFVLNVAHYVIRQKPEAQFRILGSGTLYRHLTRVVDDLGIAANVSVVETVRSDEVGSLDILLYAPLRNDHFLPLIFAAASAVTPVSTELPGIEAMVQDGKSGFVVPVNETKPMGELVIRLLDNPDLRVAMATEFRSQLLKNFDGKEVAMDYEKEFFGAAQSQAARAA